MRLAPAIAAIGIASLLAAAAVRLFRPRDLAVEIGAFDHPFATGGPRAAPPARARTGGWGRSDRLDVDEAEAAGGPSSFYYRPAVGTLRLTLPFTAPPGPLRVFLRGTARIRATVDAFLGSTRLSQVLVPPGRWDRVP